MTLMQTIISSRYLTVAALLEPVCWPDGTVMRDDDVLVHDESLATQGGRATPAVRIGPVGTIRPGTVAGARRYISVVLTRVLAVAPGARHGWADVHVDADLHRCAAYTDHIRVLGRKPSRRSMKTRLHAGVEDDGLPIRLPRDTQVGDLLAIPCEGTITPSEIRLPPATAGSDDDQAGPRCARHTHT